MPGKNHAQTYESSCSLYRPAYAPAQVNFSVHQEHCSMRSIKGCDSHANACKVVCCKVSNERYWWSSSPASQSPGWKADFSSFFNTLPKDNAYSIPMRRSNRSIISLFESTDVPLFLLSARPFPLFVVLPSLCQSLLVDLFTTQNFSFLFSLRIFYFLLYDCSILINWNTCDLPDGWSVPSV
jgi:hypothetical protein